MQPSWERAQSRARHPVKGTYGPIHQSGNSCGGVAWVLLAIVWGRVFSSLWSSKCEREAGRRVRAIRSKDAEMRGQFGLFS